MPPFRLKGCPCCSRRYWTASGISHQNCECLLASGTCASCRQCERHCTCDARQLLETYILDMRSQLEYAKLT